MKLFMVMVVLVATTIPFSSCTFKKWKKFYKGFEPFFDFFQQKKPRHHGKVFHKETIHHKEIPIIIPVGHLGTHFGYAGPHEHDYGHGGYIGRGHGHKGHKGQVIIVGHGHGGHLGVGQGYAGDIGDIGHGFGEHVGLGGPYDFGGHEEFGHGVGQQEYDYGYSGGQHGFHQNQGFDHYGYGHDLD